MSKIEAFYTKHLFLKSINTENVEKQEIYITHDLFEKILTIKMCKNEEIGITHTSEKISNLKVTKNKKSL